jgi:hypothetical protein
VKEKLHPQQNGSTYFCSTKTLNLITISQYEIQLALIEIKQVKRLLSRHGKNYYVSEAAHENAQRHRQLSVTVGEPG